MVYTEDTIRDIVESQRKFFLKGETLDVEWRIEQLKKLKYAIMLNEDKLVNALVEDIARSSEEAFFCDIGPVYMEINEMIAKLRKWAKPEHHYSGMACFPSITTTVYKMPYGNTLIISPFNFPIMLTFVPLASAIAGGNTCVIKASSKSSACTKAMQELIAKTFPPEYVTLIDGGHEVADYCLAQRFDKIFYTGSPRIGKHVLKAAADNLTPVALELGGETGNWCVIRKDANLKDAARKIAFFKLCNAGQICININQVAVAEEVADEFVEELKKAYIKQIGSDPVNNAEYPRLIAKSAYDKCANEAEEYRDRIVLGGNGNPETLKYAPTVIYPVGIDEPIVNHEVFCPLLSIVPYKDAEIDSVMATIAEREHGLALYVFTGDMKWANKVMSSQQYGGGCINEVCLHLMVKGVPFNGTGHSGMGAYHGEWGFKEFTHPSTVLKGCTRFNLPLREHPYTGIANKYKMIALKLFER
ncbi:MAG: aldehyde dehydrogenase family protein [Clostridiales bacterium]|nr:aldehyde dehydrogenase family protein [Candidatus Crickella caballi]